MAGKLDSRSATRIMEIVAAHYMPFPADQMDNEDHLLMLQCRAGVLAGAVWGKYPQASLDDAVFYMIGQAFYWVACVHPDRLAVVDPVMLNNGIWAMIHAERDRQIAKWGDNRDLPDKTYFRILTEEIGETAAAIEEQDWGNLLEEIIQVAAVGVAWLQRG